MPYLRATAIEPYYKRSKTMYNRAKDSEFIPKWGRPRKFDTPMKAPKKSDPNSILRVVVWNSAYEVTTDTLHYLFSQYSSVLRIVLFTQNGLPNGMIEMDSVEGERGLVKLWHFLRFF